MSQLVMEVPNDLEELPPKQKPDTSELLTTLRNDLSDAILELKDISKKINLVWKSALCRRTGYLDGKHKPGMCKKNDEQTRIFDTPNINDIQIRECYKQTSTPPSSNFNDMSSHSAPGKIVDISPPFECKDVGSTRSTFTGSPPIEENSEVAPELSLGEILTS